MKAITLLLFSLISFQTLLAQSSLEIFKDELPNTIKLYKKSMQQLSAPLEYYKTLDPRLTIYYIEYLKEKFGNKNNNNETNYYNFLKNKEAAIAKARNEQIQKEIDFVNQGTFSLSTKLSAINSLEKLIINRRENTRTTQNNDKNNNVVNYYAYKLLLPSTGSYSATINYTDMLNKYMKNIAERLQLSYNRNDLKPSEAQLLAKEALEYPYLFKGNWMEKNFNIMNITLSEYLTKMLSISSKTHFAVSPDISFGTLNSSFSFENVYSETTHPFKEFKFNSNLDVSYSLALSLKFRIPFRSEIGIFSFADISAGILLLSSSEYSSDVADTSYQFYQVYPGSGVFSADYSVKGIGNTSFNAYFASLSVPVYYFGNKLYLSVGGIVIYWKYSADVVRLRKVITSDPLNSNLGAEDFEETLSVNNSKIGISPLIKATYVPFNNFEVFAKFGLSNVLVGANYFINLN